MAAKHSYKKRVRYGETDQMGYLYYGNYATYYEIGRVELMRSIGITYKDLEEKMGIMMPVASMEVKYLRPALYDQEIRIETSIEKIPEKFIIFRSELFNEDDKLINVGLVKLCFVDIKQGKTLQEPPSFIKEILGEYF